MDYTLGMETSVGRWTTQTQRFSLYIRDQRNTLSAEFSIFPQEMLDLVVGTLRGRGNSNATINRKMAALSKLLRKACKMGTIHSLPEFRRQKERAGRIRFLEIDEEDRLFAAIAKRSMEYHRLSVFLVDTGARIGEATAIAVERYPRWARNILVHQVWPKPVGATHNSRSSCYFDQTSEANRTIYRN